MKEAIDRIVSSLDAGRKDTGLVVGVVNRDGSAVVWGYGRATDASPEPPRGDTLFEIGSVTKVFTTALLSIVAAEGLVRLEDPVRDLVPELSQLPPEITLARLATHTSGLPKMPFGPVQSLRRDRRNPFATYTTADLLGYLATYKPSRRVTDRVSYSNVGMALLGYILAQALGTSYEQAVVTKICDELDLPDTRVTLMPEQKARLSTPHQANGKPGHNWDLRAFAGAAALHSTANDLLKFLAANLGAPPVALTAVLQASHTIRPGTFPPAGILRRLVSRLYLPERAPDQCEQHMALGWHVGQLAPGERRVYWRHGATGGYRAFVGWAQDSGTGVVVLANRSLGLLDTLLNFTSADRIGFSVLEHLDRSDR